MKLALLHEGHWVKAEPTKKRWMSPLIDPSDRDEFIAWGKPKKKKKLKESITTLGQELHALRPQIAAAAQKVYDDWDPRYSGAYGTDLDDEYGGGGICDAVAAEMAGTIVDSIECEIYDGGQPGDDHAFVLVARGDEGYAVDIPPYVYESGGGMNWQKTHGVTFDPNHVEIFPLDKEVVRQLSHE